MRLTQTDRLLLALEGAEEAEKAYEINRRFSQRGLSEILEMEQSQVSRTAKRLLAEKMVRKEKRRVDGERWRVLVYLPTQNGLNHLDTLITRMLGQKVLSPDREGLLKRKLFSELIEEWKRNGWQTHNNSLDLADILRLAPTRDGLPLIQRDDAMQSIERTERKKDLATETIGYLLKLATLERDKGEVESASQHLLRAADLHRLKGDLAGEVAFLLASGANSSRHMTNRLSDLSKEIDLTDLDSDWWQTMSEALPEHKRKGWLLRLWNSRPEMPLAGHVGLALMELGEDVGDQLEEMFRVSGQQDGVEAVKTRRKSLK